MSKQTATFYNRFSFLYPLIDFFLWPQKKVLFDQINLLPHGQLLEIGVGSGSHLHLYERHRITGIDTSRQMLEMASNRKIANVQLLEMSGEELSFPDETFDYVVLSHVLAVVEDPEKMLQEVARVLKPGGKVFILNHFTPDNWLKHLDHWFSIVCKRLHFKSIFHIQDIKSIKHFMLLKEAKLGSLSYFKLLIYLKK